MKSLLQFKDFVGAALMTTVTTPVTLTDSGRSIKHQLWSYY